MRTGIIIPARVQSSRLPNKILRRVGNETILEILLRNIVPYNPHPVILAIPNDEENNIIVDIVKQKNIPVEIYRGHDDSPSRRMLAVAKEKRWDYVVRLTHDNPIIDTTILRQQIKHTENNGIDYCYIKKMPTGTSGEVIRVKTLEKIIDDLGDNKNCEYLTYLLQQSWVKQSEFIPSTSYQYNARLTIDYPEDLMLFKIIHNNLAKGYHLDLVINYLKMNGYLLNINKQPMISVVITNYNYSKYIIDAIASVALQTERDWECIIQDDCSTDNSLSKIMHYLGALNGDISKQFKVHSSHKNIGLGAICNDALNKVRGKYYIRLDADDILRNDALFVMRKRLDEEEQIQGVWSGFGEFGEEVEAKKILPSSDNYEYHPACCMLRTETVKATGYREQYRFYEGADFLSKFRKAYDISIVHDDLWLRRIHPAQMTNKKNESELKEIADKLNEEGINV